MDILTGLSSSELGDTTSHHTTVVGLCKYTTIHLTDVHSGTLFVTNDTRFLLLMTRGRVLLTANDASGNLLKR